MTYAKSVTSTAETPIGEQSDAIPESRSHDGAVGEKSSTKKTFRSKTNKKGDVRHPHDVGGAKGTIKKNLPRRCEHLRETGSARRSLVANDNDVATLDLLPLDPAEHELFIVVNPGGTLRQKTEGGGEKGGGTK